MKRKEMRVLFQPTVLKIILFLVLFLAFVPFAEFDSGIRCFAAPCPSTSIGSIFYYLVIYPGVIYRFFPISILVGLVSAYLIACLLARLVRNMKI